MTESQREKAFVSNLIILALCVWALAMSFGCTASPSAPSPVIVPVAVPVALQSGTAFVPRPFTGGDVNWHRRIIGNPWTEPLTVTVMWASADCSTRYGNPQTVTVGPLTIGTFEPPKLACGEVAWLQGDGARGRTEPICRTPEFSSQTLIEFRGEDCGEQPPPPPPPPPPMCETVTPTRIHGNPSQPPTPICQEGHA